MKNLTLNSILLAAVASVTVACASQEAKPPMEVTSAPEVIQPQVPEAAAQLPESQIGGQQRSAIEAADPSLPEQDPIQFKPEANSPPQSNTP